MPYTENKGKKLEDLTPYYHPCGICGTSYNTRTGGMIKGKMVCIDCYRKFANNLTKQ